MYSFFYVEAAFMGMIQISRDELKEIMEWSKNNVTSTLHICWASQAGLYYHYGINKYPLEKKRFGVFLHDIHVKNYPLTRGFDDNFWAPHSRHTTILREDIEKIKEMMLISESEEAGVYIVASKDNKNIFVTGHSEYDSFALKSEYDRDIAKGMKIDIPKNYFKDDDPKKEPIVKWRSHSNLLFANWINYYVYQTTPYDLKDIS